MQRDVLIVGGGPAAFAAAVACGAAGLRTVLLGGRDVAWPANYGIWTDDARSVGIGDTLGPEWNDAGVVFGDDDKRWLGRPYARVAKRRLRTRLLAECADHGVEVHWAFARAVDHDATGSTVTDEHGTAWRTSMVIDASGHDPVFVARDGEPTTFQAAFGLLGTPSPNIWETDRMTFMDMRTDHVDDELGDAAPSFLYVMPMGPQRVFVEETSLRRAPAMPLPLLRRRLGRRLDRLGLEMRNVEASELCLIPMDAPLPHLDQRVVGFGAAAGFVQAISGYSLERSFSTAPDLARVLADGLDRGVAPGTLARDAWAAMWTPEDLLRRDLHLFGAEILSSLDADGQRAFFRAFFDMPAEHWSAYLATRGDVSGVLRAMASMLAHARFRTRWTLLRSGSRLPAMLLRSVV